MGWTCREEGRTRNACRILVKKVIGKVAAWNTKKKGRGLQGA
jgi:hypothetical protein